MRWELWHRTSQETTGRFLKYRTSAWYRFSSHRFKWQAIRAGRKWSKYIPKKDLLIIDKKIKVGNQIEGYEKAEQL